MESKTENTPTSLLDAAGALEADPEIIWVRLNINPGSDREWLDIHQDARVLGLRLETYGEKTYAVRE